MSFMDKIKSQGRGDGARRRRPTMSQFDDVVAAYPDGRCDADAPQQRRQHAGVGHAPSQATQAISRRSSPRCAVGDGGRLQRNAAAGPVAADGRGAALPLIGNSRCREQQRILRRLVVLLGLLGLVLATVLALSAASRGADQVAAIGQALMQSQRLAKSVSQALIGSAAGLPGGEGKRRRAGQQRARPAQTARATCAAAPAAVQDSDRAAAAAGRSRREERRHRAGAAEDADRRWARRCAPINRQSADLLEIAETVSSLKLQQEATPAELSAVGQLVMLTQRIGKSANEFLTIEGVSPEAVFLLGKDLNSFREIAEGLINGNAELRLPGTKDAQTKERLRRADQAVRSRRARRRARFSATCRAWWPRARRRPAILADSEPLRKGLETLQERLGRRPAACSALHLAVMLLSALLLLAGGVGFLRLFVQRPGARARRSPKASGRKPSARSRKPSASTTPTRRPFCD